MTLTLKEFPIDTTKIDKRFKIIVSSNYDGIIQDQNNLIVNWKEEPSTQDLQIIQTYWDNLTLQVYNATTTEEQVEYLSNILVNARNFGNGLIAQFALENVSMGITAAGKTRAVADYCYKIQYYLGTGSLYAAVEELTERINLNDSPAELAPFVSSARLTIYLNKLKVFLNIP